MQKINQDIWANLQNKHIFLTGGTGFFGKSFLDLLVRENVNNKLNLKITILSRNPDEFVQNYPHLVKENINFLKGDILDFEYVALNIDYILHFATPASAKLNNESPLIMFDIVQSGTRRVLDYAKFLKVKSVLLASSGAVYGKQPASLTHIPETYSGAPDLMLGSSAYGEGKRTAELLGNLYSSIYGFEHKIARCFAFVGPYLDQNTHFAIGNFIGNAVQNENIIINGDGTDYRSYLYSDDLIIALLTILLFGKNNQPYNVGSDQSISIKELAELVSKLVNDKIKIEIKKTPTTGANPNRYIPNVDLLKNELGFTPSVSLEQAILKSLKR
jgi:dTDP-glucose 4,6-dehydratase